MDYQHPHLTVSEPSPGHYVIENLRYCVGKDADGRTVCAPSSCYISPMVPSDLLAAIIADRELATAENLSFPGDPLNSNGELQTVPVTSTNPALSDEARYLSADIVNTLTGNGTTRLNDLANALNVEKDAIKALDGQGFHIANAGWVKLGQKEGEA